MFAVPFAEAPAVSRSVPGTIHCRPLPPVFIDTITILFPILFTILFMIFRKMSTILFPIPSRIFPEVSNILFTILPARFFICIVIFTTFYPDLFAILFSPLLTHFSCFPSATTPI